MRLGDLLDISALERLADANYKATGMPMGIVDALDGSVLVGVGWQEICVTYHRANPASAERCRESDEYIKAHLSETVPCEYTCRNGLRDIGIPIRVAGAHLATMFLGQFFYEGEARNRDLFVRQARELGFDQASYLAALDRVPVFSRASVENILSYNAALARVISDLAEGSLRRREAEERAESLARFAKEDPDPVLRVASDSTVLYANAAACSTLEDLGLAQGSPAPSVIADLARRARSEGKRIRSEIASGGRSFSVSVVPVGGEVNLYAQDITARRQAEDALGRERSILSSVMHATDAMLVYLDPDFNFVWVNDAYAATCGMRPDEMVGRNHFALYPHAENEAIFRRVRDSGEPVFYKDKPFEFPDQPHRGVTYWDWSLVPVKDASAEVKGLVFSLRETTKFKRAQLERDAERRRTEQALRDADRRKDEFLGILSHELRNPLAPIRNSIHVLRHAEAGSERVLRAQDVIERQTEHLTRLVDDLLDVTRIARGKIELRRSPVDLRGIVSSAADDFRPLLQRRGVELHVAVPDVSLLADADATRIAQIVGNLLHNSAKFTRQGDEVTLSLRRAGERQAEIRVKDTGAGIEPALLPRLFETFVQGERTLARTEGGLGLGLALVKGIAELHGGTAGVESAGRGKGAEFVVSLPLASSGMSEPPPQPRAARARAVRRVLVVDDNADAAESLAELARVLGHVADTAHDGPSAIEKVRLDPPDVVLCDIGLPGMSGYEVARELRAKTGADIRLVAVSGYAQPEDVKRAMDAGFDEHVTKPADPDEIERLLTATRGEPEVARPLPGG